MNSLPVDILRLGQALPLAPTRKAAGSGREAGSIALNKGNIYRLARDPGRLLGAGSLARCHAVLVAAAGRAPPP